MMLRLLLVLLVVGSQCACAPGGACPRVAENVIWVGEVEHRELYISQERIGVGPKDTSRRYVLKEHGGSSKLTLEIGRGGLGYVSNVIHSRDGSLSGFRLVYPGGGEEPRASLFEVDTRNARIRKLAIPTRLSARGGVILDSSNAFVWGEAIWSTSNGGETWSRRTGEVSVGESGELVRVSDEYVVGLTKINPRRVSFLLLRSGGVELLDEFAGDLHAMDSAVDSVWVAFRDETGADWVRRIPAQSERAQSLAIEAPWHLNRGGRRSSTEALVVAPDRTLYVYRLGRRGFAFTGGELWRLGSPGEDWSVESVGSDVEFLRWSDGRLRYLAGDGCTRTLSVGP